MTPSSPFGRYVLKGRIARGGMGEVFLASAIGADGFEKRVVVKRVLPGLAGQRSFAQLFAEEARLMTRLEHPNIVQVIDYGRGALGDAFLVMELVDGADLRAFHLAHTERGVQFPLGFVGQIATQVLRGLEFAHTRAELVHRDISPGNVLLSRAGEVKVADFGVAQVELVDGALLVGKPAYVSPEQLTGGVVDLRSDLFAVAAMLYELLTGQPPFNGRDRGNSPTPLGVLRPDVPAKAAELLHRALSVDPDLRPSSARELSKALSAAMGASSSADDLGDAVAEFFPAVSPSEGIPNVARVAGLPEHLTELTRAGPSGQLDWAEVEPKADEGLYANLRAQPDPTGAETWHTETLEDELPASAAPLADRSSHPLPDPARAGVAGTEASAPAPVNAPRYRSRSLALGLGGGVALSAAVLGLSLLAPPFGGGLTAQWPGTSTAGIAGTTGATQPPDSEGNSALGVASSAAASGASSRVGTEASAGSLPAAPSAPAVPSGELKPRAPDIRAETTRAGHLPASAKAMATPPPSASCSGSLQIFSSGSWSVSGGPGAVQSPGRYTWPCGRYNLRAVSRLDPSVSKGGSVMIREGTTATLDLR